MTSSEIGTYGSTDSPPLSRSTIRSLAAVSMSMGHAVVAGHEVDDAEATTEATGKKGVGGPAAPSTPESTA